LTEFWVVDLYGCQLFPLYNELKSNTQERMNIVIGGSIGSAVLTYEVISVFGYLTFGSKVRSSIQCSMFLKLFQ
jgi:amino acid permease